MDLEKFDKWSAQFQSMLSRLELHEQALQTAAKSHPLADTPDLSDCASQVQTDKYLTKMANDIRALGFCYNSLRESMYLPHEQFDALE